MFHLRGDYAVPCRHLLRHMLHRKSLSVTTSSQVRAEPAQVPGAGRIRNVQRRCRYALHKTRAQAGSLLQSGNLQSGAAERGRVLHWLLQLQRTPVKQHPGLQLRAQRQPGSAVVPRRRLRALPDRKRKRHRMVASERQRERGAATGTRHRGRRSISLPLRHVQCARNVLDLSYRK